MPPDKGACQRGGDVAGTWWNRKARICASSPIFIAGERIYMASNPRSSNGALRRKHRARFRAMNAPCGICRGRLGPIDYNAPSDSAHPLSFVIDEVRPVSRWREFGYDSAEAAAQDWNNLQAAHYICNQKKAARVPEDAQKRRLPYLLDGRW